MVDGSEILPRDGAGVYHQRLFSTGATCSGGCPSIDTAQEPACRRTKAGLRSHSPASRLLQDLPAPTVPGLKKAEPIMALPANRPRPEVFPETIMATFRAFLLPGFGHSEDQTCKNNNLNT